MQYLKIHYLPAFPCYVMQFWNRKGMENFLNKTCFQAEIKANFLSFLMAFI